jgi:Fe-S oxidoreductase
LSATTPQGPSSDDLHPLELEAVRLSVKKPATRYDKQGERSDAERLRAAMDGFAKDFSRDAGTYLESCIHCGNCAEACPFYLETEDPKYTPIYKVEPFKQAYQREAGPFAWLYRTLGLKPAVTVAQLEEWQELIYDSCTLCGRCTMVCPMDIDIASLVGLARHGMFAAGLVPHELWAVAERAEREGSPLGATPKVLKERIEWLADDYEVDIPVDAREADVLATFSSIEIMKYPQSLVATAQVLNHAGYSWTVSTSGYEATNFGMLSGNAQWQRHMSMKLIDAAIACQAKILILPECGHAYTALRWQGANMLGRALPFRVLHISEFLAENIANGRIRTRKMHSTVTFHDPCQVSRRGGATAAPRVVFEALGLEERRTEDSGDLNLCCGGGGGVVVIHRADALRHQTFARKIAQIEQANGAILASSCSNCRQTFDDGAAHFKWDRKMASVLEMVADHLEAGTGDRRP